MKPQLALISSEKRLNRSEPLLNIENLGKVFRTGDSFLTVLEGINFSVKRGELICLLGRSGCGKSTLLKILAGFLPASSGRVELNGKQVSGPGPDRCVVFQEDTLFPWLTVEENIAFGLRGCKKDKKAVREEVDHFLSLVGLGDFGKFLPREISGGMKQRVALARVLILKPQVLLMDEPFASLDAQTREEMQNLLLGLWEKLSHTILFVTHDVNEVVCLADRVLIMDKEPGRIFSQIPIGLPRPRKRETTDFIRCCRQLHEGLRR